MATTRRRVTMMLATGLLLPLALPGAARGADPTVDMTGSAYTPRDLTVSVGETVTWVNKDPVLHDAVDVYATWQTPKLNPNQSASVTFDTAGMYTYRCTLHAGMRATLTVLDSAPSTDTEPSAILSDTGSGLDGAIVFAAGLMGLLVATRRLRQAPVSR